MRLVKQSAAQGADLFGSYLRSLSGPNVGSLGLSNAPPDQTKSAPPADDAVGLVKRMSQFLRLRMEGVGHPVPVDTMLKNSELSLGDFVGLVEWLTQQEWVVQAKDNPQALALTERGAEVLGQLRGNQ